ncbi:MAG: bifunctional demethylmenaquinone methyltransferase/2-methoxy-6-polyprenyl-1,4-benzoquinol methylase UbiE [Leucobacter sp.]
MTRPDTATKSAADVSTMFDEVSPRYDLINDVLSAGQSRLWRVAMTRALQPRKGMRVLDLAAGTGTSSAAIARHGAEVTAADFSEGMLAVGRERQAGNELIEFVHADATALPFEDDSFDAATISFGLRNVSDPRRALAEMRRVVRPGGRIVICEFSKPPAAAIRAPYAAYSRHVLPRVAGLLNGEAKEAYRYLNESIEAWPAQAELAAWLREAGLERVAYRNLSLGIVALHRGFVPREAPKHEAEAGSTQKPETESKPKAQPKPKPKPQPRPKSKAEPKPESKPKPAPKQGTAKAAPAKPQRKPAAKPAAAPAPATQDGDS